MDATAELAADLVVVPVDKPDEVNVIVGQAHFIKTVEDLYEALIGSAPGLRFGLAFCEASGLRLVRWAGNDDDLTQLARSAAEAIGAGHVFVVFLRDGFPINVLNAVKTVPEVCGIFAATANMLQVIVARSSQGRGVVGVIDGEPPLGIEGEKDIADRKELLRRFGYKM
jgi:adenosine/AMP kinase